MIGIVGGVKTVCGIMTVLVEHVAECCSEHDAWTLTVRGGSGEFGDMSGWALIFGWEMGRRARLAMRGTIEYRSYDMYYTREGARGLWAKYSVAYSRRNWKIGVRNTEIDWLEPPNPPTRTLESLVTFSEFVFTACRRLV